MKKLNKLIVLAAAIFTMSAMAITASAAIKEWNEKTIKMGEVKSNYYLANNTIHYSKLLGNYDKNFLVFSGVDKRLMEGNIVLSVDFSDRNSDREGDISDEIFDRIPEYMDGLYLKDANGKFITEGKYPLTVNYNAPDAYINVMVDTNKRVFNNFDLTQGCYAACSAKTNYFDLYFQIKDMIVLPSYNIVLKEITSSSKAAEFTGKFIQNYSETYRKNGQEYDMTCGYVEFLLPPEYAGKSFYAYINGMKVGKVTLPKKFGEKASLVNY